MGIQRIDQNILAGALVGVPSILSSVSLGLTQNNPVGGAITGAAVATAIDKGFYQNRGDAIAGLPIAGQTHHRLTKNMRGQIGHLDAGQKQEAAVTDDFA